LGAPSCFAFLAWGVVALLVRCELGVRALFFGFANSANTDST